jgi:hypothetical protein
LAEKTLQVERDHLAELELRSTNGAALNGATLDNRVAAAAHENTVREGPITPTMNVLTNADANPNCVAARDDTSMNVDVASVNVLGAAKANTAASTGNTNTPSTTSTIKGKTQARDEAGGSKDSDSESDTPADNEEPKKGTLR